MAEKTKAPEKKDKAKEKGAAGAKAPKGEKGVAKAADSKGKAAAEALPKDYIPRPLKIYREEGLPALMKRFAYQNRMQAPKLVKIVLNMGIGDAVEDQKYLDAAAADMQTITGQKPMITRAKKSISNFKLREKMPIGCMVTLRGFRMYEFLDRFISIAVPRIRDFRGLSDKSFDGRGNYSISVREQIIFPEINYDKILKIRGMNITFVTTAKSDEEAYELLASFGMPFRKR
ncbi:50S ribosomal protein L5 [candidate division KSB1 bacterium]|nr:50S ribosomal protein L5 [candidate division KSB1 bacterium]